MNSLIEHIVSTTAGTALFYITFVVSVIVLAVVLKCDVTLLKFTFKRVHVQRGESVWKALTYCKKTIIQILIALFGLGTYTYAVASTVGVSCLS